MKKLRESPIVQGIGDIMLARVSAIFITDEFSQVSSVSAAERETDILLLYICCLINVLCV